VVNYQASTTIWNEKRLSLFNQLFDYLIAVAKKKEIDHSFPEEIWQRFNIDTFLSGFGFC
jgi:hypothetical protein